MCFLCVVRAEKLPCKTFGATTQFLTETDRRVEVNYGKFIVEEGLKVGQ
jgi:hypothetical protein